MLVVFTKHWVEYFQSYRPIARLSFFEDLQIYLEKSCQQSLVYSPLPWQLVPIVLLLLVLVVGKRREENKGHQVHCCCYGLAFVCCFLVGQQLPISSLSSSFVDTSMEMKKRLPQSTWMVPIVSFFFFGFKSLFFRKQKSKGECKLAILNG